MPENAFKNCVDKTIIRWLRWHKFILLEAANFDGPTNLNKYNKYFVYFIDHIKCIQSILWEWAIIFISLFKKILVFFSFQ